MSGIKMRGLSLRCLMLGHDDRIQRASGRMFLECAECGRETRGWNLSDRSSRAAARVRRSARQLHAVAGVEPNRRRKEGGVTDRH